MQLGWDAYLSRVRHCCCFLQLCPGGIVLFSDKQCNEPEDLVEPLKGVDVVSTRSCWVTGG